MNSQPSKWSLTKINHALRDGSLTSVELVEDCINNLRPELSAYREWTPEKATVQAQAAADALAQAKDFGTLQGIPISLPDP